MKKHTNFRFLAVVLAICLAFSCEIVDPDLPFDTGEPKFNMDLFEQNVKDALQDETVGFSYTINLNGKWERKGASGFARTALDGELEMSENTRINIASISKLVSTIAALKLIDENPNVSINTPIGEYLPENWNPTDDVANITFAQLLNHTSGLHIPGSEDGEPEQLFYNLRDVVENTPVGINTYDYVNINFALFRVLIPHLVGEVKLSSEISPDFIYATLYEKYIQENILNPIGIGSASLKQENGDALLYRFPYDNSTGEDPGDWTMISGAGGWYMSAFQLANFIAFIWHSEELISKDMRHDMNNNLLGLSESLSNGDHGTYQAKGGGLRYDSSPKKGVDCMVMNFPNGVQISVICNSTGPGTFPLNPKLRDAFDDAWE